MMDWDVAESSVVSMLGREGERHKLSRKRLQYKLHVDPFKFQLVFRVCVLDGEMVINHDMTDTERHVAGSCVMNDGVVNELQGR